MGVFQMNYGGGDDMRSTLHLTFDSDFEGKEFTLSGGTDQDVVGTVPTTLYVDTTTTLLNTKFILKSTLEDKEYVGILNVGTYYGWYIVNLEHFFATVKVYAKEGAEVKLTLDTGEVEYTGTATDDGYAKIYVYKRGVYTVSGTYDGIEATDDDLVINTMNGKYEAHLAFVHAKLTDNDWETISEVSRKGLASSYWAIGDAKYDQYSKPVGTVIWNDSYGVFIADFDHNSELEGKGISFFAFKDVDNTDVAIIDGNYGTRVTNNDHAFHMTKNIEVANMGWQYSPMRYNVLGSTNVESIANAPTDTTTNPVEGSLMATFPEELRKVMKPITKYTNNAPNGNKFTLTSAVTATIDYLPLLSPYEISINTTSVNSAEYGYQTQYAYFKNGNSAIKYKHYDTAIPAKYWTRSLFIGDVSKYICVDETGDTNHAEQGDFCFGVFAVFLV